MADTIWGTTSKPVSARKLAEIIEAEDTIPGTLYIGYPVLGTPTGAFPFDAILLSPRFGVVIFDLVEGPQLGTYKERQDEFFTRLQAKLLQYPALLARRQLAVQITTVTYAPVIRVDIQTAEFL